MLCYELIFSGTDIIVSQRMAAALSTLIQQDNLERRATFLYQFPMFSSLRSNTESPLHQELMQITLFL